MTAPGRARAALGLTLLSTLDRDHPQLAVKVRAQLSESTRNDYDTVTMLRWVPMKSHMEVSDLIREAVGRTNNADFWRRAYFEVLSRPLLGFFRSSAKFIGSPTRVFIRLTPLMVPQLLQNVGTLTIQRVERQEHFAEANFCGFPASEYTMMCFVEGCTGAFIAVGAAIGVELEVTRLSIDHSGDFTLAVRLVGPL